MNLVDIQNRKGEKVHIQNDGMIIYLDKGDVFVEERPGYNENHLMTIRMENGMEVMISRSSAHFRPIIVTDDGYELCMQLDKNTGRVYSVEEGQDAVDEEKWRSNMSENVRAVADMLYDRADKMEMNESS